MGVSVVRGYVKLKCGEHGRIVSFRGDVSGGIGTKVSVRQVVKVTLTTCLVIYDSIYNRSRALSPRAHIRSVGRFEGLLVPRTEQQEHQT